MAPLSQKEKENQKAAREKKCPHCDKPYDRSHLADYIFTLKGNTIVCHFCIKEGFVVSPDGKLFWAIPILSFLIAVAVSLGIVLAITAATYNPYQGTVKIVWWLWAGGFVAVSVITRFLSRVSKWSLGSISLEPIDRDFF